MQITWQGAHAFTIAAKGVSIATDPRNRAETDIITLSDSARREGLATKAAIVDWPGEYEMKNAFIIGIPAAAPAPEAPVPRTLFVIEVEGISIGHLGGLTGKLSVEQVEQLGDIDILLLPVGGDGLDPATAKLVIEQIDPRMLVPMGDDLTARQGLLAQLGTEPEQIEGPLKVEDRDLPQETTRLVFFAPPA